MLLSAGVAYLAVRHQERTSKLTAKLGGRRLIDVVL
jgi:hypothetical protein